MPLRMIKTVDVPEQLTFHRCHGNRQFDPTWPVFLQHVPRCTLCLAAGTAPRRIASVVLIEANKRSASGLVNSGIVLWCTRVESFRVVC